jgi:hypothetical protein
MLDVTADDLGLWLAGSEYRNWIEFSIAVVDLAIEYGRPVDSDSWESDKAILLAGVGYDEVLSSLDESYYDSLDYLNNNLPKDYFFYVTDGLYLVYNKES